MVENYIFILLVITCVLVLLFIIKLSREKSKNQTHWLILVIFILDFIWASGVLVQKIVTDISGHSFFPIVYYYAFGNQFLPYVLLIFTITYFKPETKINPKITVFLFIIPTVLYLLTLTNNYHHLVYKYYSIGNDVIFGPAINFSSIFGFILYIINLGFFIYSLCNNYRLFFKQALIIGFGLSIILITSIFTNFRVLSLPLYANATGVSGALLLIFYGLSKYNISEVNQITLKLILDSISDSFVVLDKNLNFISCNKSFDLKFTNFGKDSRGNFSDLLKIANLKPTLVNSINNNKTSSIEIGVYNNAQDKNSFFIVEAIPILTDKNSIGLIVLFKETTEIRQMQDILIMKERYASLGMFVGSIMHSIKTPLMTLSLNIDGLKSLAEEYQLSISDSNVTVADHEEIAHEMKELIDKTNSNLENISRTLNYVKNQIVPKANEEQFTLSELLTYIHQFMKYEQNRNYHLIVNNSIENDIEIKGSMSFLIQVISNLITNAIHSYNGSKGTIELTINEKNNHLHFIVRDWGSGIDQEVQKRLFKEMITTKGKNGTGLGLYISFSIIKSYFKGDIWFTSAPKEGTQFHISIPITNEA